MRDKILTALRAFVQKYLTPTPDERSMVSAVYGAVCAVLGRDRCHQIGSFPRFTAISPPHDLDVLFSADKWPGHEPDAATVLSGLAKRLQNELIAPNGFKFAIRLQTHSITVYFTLNGEEKFAVDIVPAWTSGTKNEFGDDVYWVPEILLKGHSKRLRTYKRLAEKGGHIDYVLSDPKGYISIAAALNAANADFRKSVKVPKRWKCWAKDANDEFKMKSFHIEQIITTYFKQDGSQDILSAVMKFFEDLPSWLSHSQIPDRADSSRNIDAYVDELTSAEKAIILQAGVEFLERLRTFDGSRDASVLFETKSKSAAVSAASSAGSSGAPAIITERSRVTPRAPFGDN